MKCVSQTILSCIVVLNCMHQAGVQASSQITPQKIEVVDIASIPTKSQIVVAATASCLADQYTFNISDPRCNDCPVGTFRSIPSISFRGSTPYNRAYYPMSFTWSGSTWIFNNRMYGYWADYPVYYSPGGFWGAPGGYPGNSWYYAKSWIFSYHFGGQGIDGSNCACGNGGWGSFGADPHLQDVMAAATNVQWCKECPTNLVCQAGTYISYKCKDGRIAECTNCPAGKFAEFALTNQLGESSCTLCPAGTYLNTIGAVGATSCLSCGTGLYSPATQSTTCTVCSTGTFNPAVGQSVCVSCAPGTYSNVTGRSTCISCEKGSIAAQVGTSDCQSCSSGLSAPSAGMSTCITCAS
jgi:hypothetical protein